MINKHDYESVYQFKKTTVPKMEKLLLYQVKTTWKEGRLGEINSTVLDSVIEVATPPEFAKGVERKWSPEHLMAAAVSSCFMTTFLTMAEKMRLNFKHFECSSTLLLEQNEGKLFATQIIIHPIVTIINSMDSGKGLKVINITAKSCIVSAMLKTEIVITPQIIIEPDIPE